LNATTCSPAAWHRGAGQKVAAYSFYGDPNSSAHKERHYFRGVAENLALLPTLYNSSWSLRLYHDLPPESSLLAELCALACSSPGLDLCPAPRLPRPGLANASRLFPMVWRFLPSLDPQVPAGGRRSFLRWT
jgi:hypothetical protein